MICTIFQHGETIRKNELIDSRDWKVTREISPIINDYLSVNCRIVDKGMATVLLIKKEKKKKKRILEQYPDALPMNDETISTLPLYDIRPISTYRTISQ